MISPPENDFIIAVVFFARMIILQSITVWKQYVKKQDDTQQEDSFDIIAETPCNNRQKMVHSDQYNM